DTAAPEVTTTPSPDTADDASIVDAPLGDPASDSAEIDPYAHPMSERQRRRLAEQQKLAEQRTAEASRQNQFLSPLDEASDGALTKPQTTSPSVSATKV